MEQIKASNNASAAPLLLLLTDYRGLIPQRIMAWDGLDLDVIRKLTQSSGVQVLPVGAHEFDFQLLQGRSRVGVLYASSQEPRYKQYLQGIVAELAEGGAVLYPGLAHLLAHEDKAYQAHRIRRLGLEAPRSWVFGSREHAVAFLKTATYPMVGKTADGWGSTGVRLLQNEREAERFVQRQMVHRSFDKGRPRWKRALQRVVKPARSLGLVILQELVVGLEGDWKILIWGDAACGMFRCNRAKDFRASGGGKLKEIEIPRGVLDFAYRTREALGLPWASFDIGFRDGRCYLLEYQAIHFGLSIRERARSYYVKGQDGWREVQGKLPLEEKVAELILSDFAARGWLDGTGTPK